MTADATMPKTAAPSSRGDREEKTVVDPSLFVLPVRRMGVSGGTAPFFALELRDPPDGKAADHYIGKDLSHAFDEFDFYEQVLRIRAETKAGEEDASPDLVALFDYAFEYAGVLTAQEATEQTVEGDSPELDLLVMGNLISGKRKLRMLDLKIGHVTAQSGWQGKKRLNAMRQNIMDSATNSHTVGFRLEGFDGASGVIESRMKITKGLRDSITKGAFGRSELSKKRMWRKNMQVMVARSIFSHFADVHLDTYPEEDEDGGAGDNGKRYASVELSEIFLHETVHKLIGLAVACHSVKVPQKWIGSSVALGYDAGTLPIRSPDSEVTLRSSVLCKIFDWGRSELNTVKRYEDMDENMKLDRQKFWKYYTDGINNLTLCVTHTYRNHFGNTHSWEKVIFVVKDFDNISTDDLIGKVSVKVAPTAMTSVTLLSRKIKKKRGTLLYSIEWQDAPDGSRLKGWWRVHVKSAKGLAIKDKYTRSSDPYCQVYAFSTDSEFCYHESTRAMEQCLNPTWDETFYLPVAADELLMHALDVPGADIIVTPEFLEKTKTRREVMTE